MADQLFFSRDTQVFIEKDGHSWEIPVLEGFSFSQATNTSEITLSEMSDSTGTSRRGRQMFNNSLAPAEWSFSTYARPFKSTVPGAGKANGTAGYHHAVEEVLWAQMVGAGTYTTDATTAGGLVFDTTSTTALTGGTGTFTLTVDGAVSDQTTIVVSNADLSGVKVGQSTTIGTVSTHVVSVDSGAKSITFADSVTAADDATVTMKRKLGGSATTTVTGIPTETNGNGNGATVQAVYTEATGAIVLSVDQAGAGYEDDDTITVASADIAASFSTSFGRTFASDYFTTSTNGTVGTPSNPTTGTTFPGFTRATTSAGLEIGFGQSNKTTLGTFTLYFVLGGSTGDASKKKVYKISNCCVNEAGLDFDIDGITTINWSGMGTLIEDNGTTLPTGTAVNEGTADTSNFIRNRLTSLSVVSSLGGSSVTYDLVLTSGNITITNNMTYLTPETLGIVNTPLGHVTGSRSITGSFSCYLNKEEDSSAELFEKLISNTSTVTNQFALQFDVGGSSSTPRIEFDMNNCHLEVPTHSIEDVISLEANFHALPGTVEDTDEVTITYVGA